jgi:hypothetical protein
MATLVEKATDVASSLLTSQSAVNGTSKFSGGYSAQREAQDLLLNEIIRNPLMKSLPTELEALSKHVRYEGSPFPSIPINWRFAESIS